MKPFTAESRRVESGRSQVEFESNHLSLPSTIKSSRFLHQIQVKRVNVKCEVSRLETESMSQVTTFDSPEIFVFKMLMSWWTNNCSCRTFSGIFWIRGTT